MLTTEVDREGLLRLLGGGAEHRVVVVDSPSDLTDEAPRVGRLRLVWPEEPSRTDPLPTLIVTAKGEGKDFLAWASTYLEAYRPFTSLCRVIEPAWLPVIGRLTARPQLGAAECVAVALVIAEALSRGPGLVNLSKLSVRSCEATLSFCRSRATALGLKGAEQAVAEGWRLARETSRQPTRAATIDCIELVWSAATGRTTGEGNADYGRILAACRMLQEKGELSSEALNEVLPGEPLVRSIVSRMAGTREERVIAFEETVRRLGSRSRTKDAEAQFFCGYVASRLNPGSLEYVDLVTSHLGSIPTLLLWYALCSGLHPQSRVLDEFGGLGRRLLRDILRPQSPLDRPDCDLAVEELRVLSVKGGAMQAIRPSSPSCLKVEIVPLVCSVVGLSEAGSLQQLGLFETRGSTGQLELWMREVRGLVRDLNRAFEKAPGVIAEGSRAEKPRRGSRRK